MNSFNNILLTSKNENPEKAGWVLTGSMLVFLLLFSGCSTYVSYKYGITRPRAETPGSLLSFLEKNNFPVKNQYTFKDSTSYKSALCHPVFKKNLLSYIVFDSAGKYLIKDSLKCQWAGSGMIASLGKDSLTKADTSLNFRFLMNKVREMGLCSCTPDTAFPGYTIIITWAKFLGRYNYRLFELEKAIHENKNAKIRILWLNIDMQKSWNFAPGKGLKLD